MACYRLAPDGIVLTVRLTPHADRDAVTGIGALSDGQEVAHVRVRAVPEDSAANKALIALLAKTFRRPKSTIELIAGATARVKQVRIAGVPAELAAVAQSWPSEK
jgi:uncharacterized protein (TIGR00251 family)